MNKALILGATGGIGSELAIQLRDKGWQVRAMKRGLEQAAVKDGIEWVPGDALNAAEVLSAAQGCDVIVHGVNPPGYRRWAEVVLPMIDNTIAAARAQGALIVLPGTVYNYGPDAFPLLKESSPQRPLTRKGAIRVQMESRLEAAAASGDLRVLIVRAGDFFGPNVRNSWLAQAMIQPGQAVKTVKLPMDDGVAHQFAYVPDVARTMVELLDRRDELSAFARFHLAGHWDASGKDIGRAIQRSVVRHGGPEPRMTAFPWWMMRLASPFVATLREMQELRYLWRTEVRLDNHKLIEFLGHEPHTPLDEAMDLTLEGLGCVSDAVNKAPALQVA
jgi:nucleoside-diphosphate-sugar epimerase